MQKRTGSQTLLFPNRPRITAAAGIVGPMEGAGKLRPHFDIVMPDNLNDLGSWEQCESYMMETAIKTAVAKEHTIPQQLDCILAGDLLNQLMSTHFAMKKIARPFLGLYGACSTMAESMLLGAVMVDGGYAAKVAAAVSSHHDAAERQYRFPNELGSQRPPSAQWTVTGAGAAVISAQGKGPAITCATIGTVIDLGIKDPNAMGAAMAPAAADTLRQHFADTGRTPDYYDQIFTGDLGNIGKKIVIETLQKEGLALEGRYEDCGCMIYSTDQDVHAGASGCASSAVVFCSYLHKLLCCGELTKILLIGTGSLHSITSYQQKQSIPCIAHGVAVEL